MGLGSDLGGRAYPEGVPVEPRITGVEPLAQWPPSTTDELLLVIQAVYPPASRRIVDQLRAHRSMSLQDLSAASRLSLGSACHHLRELYRAGVAAPDEEHHDEQGRAWWKFVMGSLRWNPMIFGNDPQARARIEAALAANLRHLYRGLLDFLTNEPDDSAWREQSAIADMLVLATAEETHELASRIERTIDDWLQSRPSPLPDAERRPISAVYWVHPLT